MTSRTIAAGYFVGLRCRSLPMGDADRKLPKRDIALRMSFSEGFLPRVHL